MAIAVVVHVQGEDAFLADMDEMPHPSSVYVVLRNVRKKDGKQVAYLTDGATAFLYPWTRVTFIETLDQVPGMAASASAGAAPGTTVLSFFREDDRRP